LNKFEQRISTPRVAGSSRAGIAKFLAAIILHRSSSFAIVAKILVLQGFLASSSLAISRH
jgi:hypothetical protein